MGLDQELDALIRDPRFKQLEERRPFNLYRALGIESREISHSRLLATLLDPKASHGLGNKFLRAFLRALRDTQEMALSEWRSSIDDSTELLVVDSRTEADFIDVLVFLRTRDRTAVIGIENKLWAAERPKQLEDYQNKLRYRFPNSAAVILFLTPTGRPATTASTSHTVPCISMGWSVIADAIESVMKDSPGAEAGPFLMQTARHIREDIVGDDNLRRIVQELFLKYPEAMNAIVLNRPGFDGCLGRIEQEATAFLKEHGIDSEIWRRTRNELVVAFGSPRLYLVIHHYEGWNTGVFVGVPPSEFAAAENTYRDFAARQTGIVHPEYPRISGWNWRAVLANDNSTATKPACPGWHVAPGAFDTEFENQVLAEIRSFVRLLHREASLVEA